MPLKIAISFACLLIFPIAQFEPTIYTIVSDLEPLLETLSDVIYNLEEIHRKQRNSLNIVEKEIERFQMNHEFSSRNSNYHLGNPITSFTLLKRMKLDFGALQKLINGSDTELTRNISLKYPSRKDLVEAVNVVVRLQKVYRLNVTQLADGFLHTSYGEGGTTYTEYFLPMTSSDCTEISRIMNDFKLPKTRLLWLLEALRIYHTEAPSYGYSKFDIINAICDTYDALDDSGNYLKWIEKLITLKPNYNVKAINLKIHSHEIKLRKKTKIKEKKQKKTVIVPMEEIAKCVGGLDSKAFRMLCRGEVGVSSEVTKMLKCWYSEGYHPFTKLALFKIEQLYIKPDIFLFHGVLSDKEIDIIKRMALPQLSVTESMTYRLCKGMQFYENQTAPIEHLGQRISDFTGLLTSVTMLSVSNYGVGGYYVTHVDSTSMLEDKMKNNPKNPALSQLLKELSDEDIEQEMRNLIEVSKQVYRIGTVIFYLSEVTQGGATVFPTLGLTVYPIKGAALFWTNLLPSGDVDFTTCHGACPVLRGSKWIASKWINNENQELKKPCIRKVTSRKPEDVPYPVIKPRQI